MNKMRHKVSHPAGVQQATRSLRHGRSAMITYVVLMFFIFFADSIMSFTAPIIIERVLGDAFLMGLVLSSSSVVGIICDFAFTQIFQGKNYRFFLGLLLGFAFLFPLSFLVLPHNIGAFLFAMAVWGIYFELIAFSNFNFIHAHAQMSEHATAWGWIEVTRGVGATLGSFVAGILLDYHLNLPFYGTIGGLAMGLTVFLLLILRFDKARLQAQDSEKKIKKSFWIEVQTWKLLLAKIWPVFLLYLMIIMVDAAFWTVGTLLTSEIGATSFIGKLIIPAYIIPSLITPLLAAPLAKLVGKKRTAFLACIPAGIILALGSLAQLPALFVGSIFLTAIFVTLAFTEIVAVFEDYVARLDDFGTDLVGLSSAASSIAYIVGPIAAGLIAQRFGNNATFTIFGVLLSMVALLAFFAMPRKTKLPQAQLQELAQEA